MTMQQIADEMTKAGYTVSTARSWEDENGIYVCSQEIYRHAYGHPKAEASYSKKTGVYRKTF